MRISYLVYKCSALCMANMHINREMHKYVRSDIDYNGWVPAGNRDNQTCSEAEP